MKASRYRPSSRVRVGVLLVALGLIWLVWRKAETSQPTAKPAAARLTPPHLLSSEKNSPESAHAWQRLLAADGSGREDLAILKELTDAFLQSVPVAQRPPLGFDTDLARILTNIDYLGEEALPTSHPSLRDGRLIDRWGSPWLVHPLSHDVVQLRSAGPDGRLFTADDLVAPKSTDEADN